MHLNWMQSGDASLILLHTELLQPIMFDAPSEAKPMQLPSVWPLIQLDSLSGQRLQQLWLCSTGTSPKKPTAMFCSPLKYLTRMHKCFWIDMSVDSSTALLMHIFYYEDLFFNFSFRQGANTFCISPEHLVLWYLISCNMPLLPFAFLTIMSCKWSIALIEVWQATDSASSSSTFFLPFLHCVKMEVYLDALPSFHGNWCYFFRSNGSSPQLAKSITCALISFKPWKLLFRFREIFPAAIISRFPLSFQRRTARSNIEKLTITIAHTHTASLTLRKSAHTATQRKFTQPHDKARN